MDPYILLDLDAAAADDATVKSAYVQAARAYPPDKNPEMFKSIRSAFESIATERQRLKQQMFQLTPTDPVTIIYSCLRDGESGRLSSTPNTRDIFQKGVRSIVRHNLENKC
ncbi:MAG: DnaJ domain-containing protein [Pseudomonadota bacterium]